MKTFWAKNKPIILQVALALAAGAFGALLSGGQELYGELVKPPLSPPAWVFPVVWTVLYVLMGVAAGLVIKAGESSFGGVMRRYYVQLALNILWPTIFFRFELLTVALIWLVVLIGAIVRTWQGFRRVSLIAGRLLVPYLLWCLFALYLNAGFVILN